MQHVVGDGVRIQATESSKQAIVILFCWFLNNQIKVNLERCHLIINSTDEMSISLENCNIKNGKCQKLLGIKIYNKSNFNSHIDEIGKKAGQKLNVQSRVNSYMDLLNSRLLLNAFFLSHFSYFPLVGIFHSRDENNKIKRLHKRFLRIIYNHKKLPSLNYWRKITLSQFIKKIIFHPIEMFKFKRSFAPVLCT